MSVEAYVWALKLAPIPDNNAPTRQVLMVLAEAAHSDGTSAWPSNPTIVECGLSLRTVRDALRRLEGSGVVRRYVNEKGRRTYDLALWQVRTDLTEKRLRELVKKNYKTTHAGLASRGGQLLPPLAQDGGQLLPPPQAAPAPEPSLNRPSSSFKKKKTGAGRLTPPSPSDALAKQVRDLTAWLEHHPEDVGSYPARFWEHWIGEAGSSTKERTKLMRHWFDDRSPPASTGDEDLF